MDIDWITISPEEIEEYLPIDTSQELLTEIAINISNLLNTTKARIVSFRKQKEVYKHLANAKKHLDKALVNLEQGKKGFNPELYACLIDSPEKDRKMSLLIDKIRLSKGDQKEKLSNEIALLNKQTTLKRLVGTISSCIPQGEPKSIEKKELEGLYESLHIQCEKAKSDMGWYSRDVDSGGCKGDFFFLCKLASEKIGMYKSDSAIQNYLRTAAKPNREKIKQALKNLGDNRSFNRLCDELDKLS